LAFASTSALAQSANQDNKQGITFERIAESMVPPADGTYRVVVPNGKEDGDDLVCVVTKGSNLMNKANTGFGYLAMDCN